MGKGTNPMLLSWCAGGWTACGIGLLAHGSPISGALFLILGTAYTVLLIAGKIGKQEADEC